MNATELEQYKRELIDEHKAEIAAIDRLIQRERNKQSASQPSPNGAADMTRLRRSVASVVKEAALKFSGQFTRKQVAQRIAETYPNSPLSTRNVAVELWKLARDGELETVKEGRGRIPAKYKWK
jgi:hypothetical protein